MFRTVLAAAALVALSAAAHAQMGGPCMMTELTKLCGTPGTPDFQTCSREKAGEAAAACQGQGQAQAAKSKGGAAGAAGKGPCAEDMKKYCPGIWPGPELHECMSKHMSDVTPECAAYGKKMMAEHGHDKMKAGDAACVADAKRVCPGLTGLDGPKFMECMTGHYAELSPLCQKNFKGAKGDKDDADVVDCSVALKALCPDTEAGSPERTKCMIEKRDELPASCSKKKRKK